MENIITNTAGASTREDGEAFVVLDDVSLVYQSSKSETPAVSGCSLKINKGEFVSFVGPSGCGKTSVLSMIAGIIEPSAGRVLVDGKKPDPHSDTAGYMLQRDHLLEWRTIEDNALLGLEVKRALNDETRGYVRELLELCSLSQFSHHYPRQLSGGMRQKAALVRTLAFSPRLLLLDEPFSALDYQTRLILANEVRSIINKGGYTTILVTHDISEAIAMSDRVCVFSKRPARVKREIEVELYNEAGENALPLERRSMPRFNEYFDTVWSELEGGAWDEN